MNHKEVNKKIIQVFTLMFLAAVFAQETIYAFANNDYGESESLYKYNALERSVSFEALKLEISDDEEGEEESQNSDPAPAFELTDVSEVDVALKNKLEEVAKKQNISIEEINNALSASKSRSKVASFLVGSSLGDLRFHLVQIKEQISILKDLIMKIPDTEDKAEIAKQLEHLKEEKIKVESFIHEQENKFSLFGWFVNLL